MNEISVVGELLKNFEVGEREYSLEELMDYIYSLLRKIYPLRQVKLIASGRVLFYRGGKGSFSCSYTWNVPKLDWFELHFEFKGSYDKPEFDLIARLIMELITRILLYEKYKEKEAHLSSLVGLVKAFDLNLKLEDAMLLILKKALDIVGATRGSIILKEEDGLRILAAVGMSKKFLKKPKFSGAVKFVFDKGFPFRIESAEDIEKYKDYLPPGFPRDSYKNPSFLIVPLKLEGEVVGVITASERIDKIPFSFENERILLEFANYAAAVLRTAKLYADLKKFPFYLMESFSQALEAKDVYTRGHSERVTVYACVLAYWLDLPETTIQNIYQAGLVHDIGKIGIPDAVLNKPGRLTDDEYELIKMHPVIGANILAPIEFLDEIRKIVLHHHERWDGRGYPAGLAGENIPLGARVVAVADAFDAMTSNRPYRKALPVEVALAEIERGKGTQFDPDMAEVFLKKWSEIEKKWELFRDEVNFDVRSIVNRLVEDKLLR